MKKFLFCFIILMPLHFICQITHGKIQYTIKFDEKEYNGLDFYQEALKGAPRLSYSLDFTANEASFYLNPYMSTDDKSTSLAVSFAGVYSPIYSDLKKSEIRYNNNENSLLTLKEEFIITKPLKMEWIIGTESKMIDGYLCFKATSTYNTMTSRGIVTYPVVAWFCPKIPVALGPKGYGGLPGLILELQEHYIVFGATSISLNMPSTPVIKKPVKGELISKEDFDALMLQRQKRLSELQKK
ncbi:hypothetical protein CHU92_13145 [Flavobacterium cyanobacteriorum]|uniref:GLPGLI family protein n=1 Tax=Flavobacterium cyanobacteriorum TaxID=2022802 RepID=A0A255YVG5_9FLAO|nr:GLPGLI family protein [Flavobacterium cyanobacteriorum]OYQ33203.1 hypothetical protein CHU92_13145 [Flavobacterium cyanobacteriorum]